MYIRNATELVLRLSNMLQRGYRARARAGRQTTDDRRQSTTRKQNRARPESGGRIRRGGKSPEGRFKTRRLEEDDGCLVRTDSDALIRLRLGNASKAASNLNA